MVKHDILGQEVWECSADEARKLWAEYPEDRHRIWTNEEVDAHILDDAGQIAECLRLKKERPGRLQ